ncbi:unnamed protein product [Echinostoma caproni]|uniref:HTH_Tnp_Tc3_2 domain-containing protein n=1 Tax=Echinostoma caproni TaxID=27848 RepID=A0A183AIP4_9TREM|nr:unnamed protein product [Echinostoma caproni]
MMKDARMTVAQLVKGIVISWGSIYTILHEKVGLRKVYVRWVPHQLREEWKAARVNWCQTMLAKFDDGSSNVVREIISDET